MATGYLTMADQANTLLAAGRADLALLNLGPYIGQRLRDHSSVRL
jgi:hypothetical protein